MICLVAVPAADCQPYLNFPLVIFYYFRNSVYEPLRNFYQTILVYFFFIFTIQVGSGHLFHVNVGGDEKKKEKWLGNPGLEYCSEFETRSQLVTRKQIKKVRTN